MQWDPEQYLQFAAERGRPFQDLLARVGAEDPSLVVDLGCGPGNLTRDLAARWPQARVEGIDSSPEMIAKAMAAGTDPRVTFAVGDLRDWQPQHQVDVLVSNATLQWVPGHLDLLPRLVDAVRPGGWLAFQVPANSADPSHRVMTDLATSTRWAAAFEGRDRARSAVAEPQTYLEVLAGHGCAVDAWETTYLHVLAGDDAIVRWTSGTGLRPYLQALPSAEDREAFLAEYRALVGRAYPQRPWGTVLPFRRVFVVAQVGEQAGVTELSGLVGLHHVQLAAPRGSEDVLRRFYGGVLGMTEVPKPPDLVGRGGVWFRAGGVELHLGVEDDFRPARKAHPGLLVADLPAYVERLAAHGVPVEWDDAFPGYRRCYLRDPHGNRLELLEPVPA